MYGDFSRLTYSRDKAYTGVWSQQGRVQLDADANEQAAILLDWLRTLAVDFIGAFGGHITRAGFRVELEGDDLIFGTGHYYVYGLRCEVHGPADHPATRPTYRGLVPGADPLPAPPYLVQLLVWERSVSAVVDLDLLEPALGPYPPDTTVRTQVAWLPAVSTALPGNGDDGAPLDKVKARDLNAEYISRQFEEYNADAGARPLLAARVVRDVANDEASIVPATSGYLGVENQLYRVEVHTGGVVGAASPTFKWSRDNGSAEFRIVAIADSQAKDSHSEVTVAAIGRDDRTGLDVGDWVELVDDTWIPHGPAAPLLAVQAIDRAERIITLGGELTTSLSLHPFLRRWDQAPDDPGGSDGIPIVESSADGNIWLELEDGVQVRFATTGAQYLRGDYWLIPARTATGRLLWPGGADPSAIPPHGPARYLVPLALVRGKEKEKVDDMRTLFTHLAWPEPGDAGGGQGK